MFGNTLLLCTAGGGGSLCPVITELRELEGTMCELGGWHDLYSVIAFKYSGKMLSPYAIIQYRNYNESASSAKNLNFNIGSARVSEGYTIIADLGECGPTSLQYIRMCWADASYNQISGWSDWITW